MKNTPIRPDEVVDAKADVIPIQIIECFNTLIAKHWNGSASKFKMKEAEELICSKLDCEAKYLYDNHYMDVEDMYRRVGWNVYFDNPGYCEDYPPTYTFKK